jgi:exosortase family protein XrtG
MPIWAGVILAVAWLLALLFWRANRVWLPYYITGTVGMALLLIFFAARVTPAEEWMQRSTAWLVHHLSWLAQVPTQTFAEPPGAIMVLVSQSVGWTMVQISVESSGLLESCVLVSMVLFYPGWSLRKKLGLIALGLAATFMANLFRLMIITTSLHYLGKDSLLVSHVLVGRLVFFVLVVLIFWMVITLPTLRTVRQKLEGEARA